MVATVVVSRVTSALKVLSSHSGSHTRHSLLFRAVDMVKAALVQTLVALVSVPAASAQALAKLVSELAALVQALVASVSVPAASDPTLAVAALVLVT